MGGTNKVQQNLSNQVNGLDVSDATKDKIQNILESQPTPEVKVPLIVAVGITFFYFLMTLLVYWANGHRCCCFKTDTDVPTDAESCCFFFRKGCCQKKCCQDMSKTVEIVVQKS